MIWILFVLLLVVGLVLAISWYGAGETIGVPFLAVPYTPKDFHWPFEEVYFQTHDGLKQRAWFVPSDQPSDTTVMVLHGRGSNAGDMLAQTECLRRDGHWNLFYYDLRGHGASEGAFTSLGPLELRDFDGAFQLLKSRFPDASRHVGVYGHSLGASLAIVAASINPRLEAVAAEGPFASVSDTIRHFTQLFYGAPAWPFVPIMLWITQRRLKIRFSDFVPQKRVGQISPRPFFLIRPSRDRRIPLAETKRIWRAARQPKQQWIAKLADHGDAWQVERGKYEKRLVAFFQKSFSSNLAV